MKREPEAKRTESWLAEHRVKGSGVLDYFAVDMTEDEILIRRSYIRCIIKQYPQWSHLTNELIDQIILWKTEKGYILEDAKGCEFILQDKKISSEESEFRRVRAMVPFEFMNLTGKDFDWTSYDTDIAGEKDLVSNFIMNYPQFVEKGMGLYIYSGTKGSGKTMLSCCILNEISKRYRGSTKFINILDFLEMTKKDFQGTESETQALYNASLLVIDDIGVQMKKEWVDTVLYRLINDRYINQKPTIYTSNVLIEDLRMDDRILDRIDSSTCLVSLPEVPVRKMRRQQLKEKMLNDIKNAP